MLLWLAMFRPTSIDVFLFTLALMAAASGFLRRFAPVVGTILAAKKDAGFSLSNLPKRVRDFLWEVLLQGKVIRERPLPGIAHALVFWGFLAFALITVNHIATGFGYPFLKEGSIYAYVAGALAIAVAVSITGLFVRRFIARPKWLGEH